jgi:hypothetical protein
MIGTSRSRSVDRRGDWWFNTPFLPRELPVCTFAIQFRQSGVSAMTRSSSLLPAIVCALLAANLFALMKNKPAAAQAPQREESKQYKVIPSNLGQDLEDRLNAHAQKGWHFKQVVNGFGTSTTWVVFEK